MNVLHAVVATVLVLQVSMVIVLAPPGTLAGFRAAWKARWRRWRYRPLPEPSATQGGAFRTQGQEQARRRS